MEHRYVAPEYQTRLNELAETLVTPERYAGQLALFKVVEVPLPVVENTGHDDFGGFDNVVPLFSYEATPPEAA